MEAPVDKINCYSNTCKMLSLFLKRNEIVGNADNLLPLLVYTIALNPPKDLILDLQFVMKYRVAEYFQGESSYFLTTMFAATQYLSSSSHSTVVVTETKQHAVEKEIPLMDRIKRKLLDPAESNISSSDLKFILDHFVSLPSSHE